MAPCTWVSIALLDGKYYACALSREPYDMLCAEVFRTPVRKSKEVLLFHNYVKAIQKLAYWLMVTLTSLEIFFV